MLKPPAPEQYAFEMVTLEELVPKDHLLRIIDRYIRFDFIHEATAHLYCHDNGRPAIEPVVLFKMLLIGYLFGIRSERQLVAKRYKVNANNSLLCFELENSINSHSLHISALTLHF